LARCCASVAAAPLRRRHRYRQGVQRLTLTRAVKWLTRVRVRETVRGRPAHRAPARGARGARRRAAPRTPPPFPYFPYFVPCPPDLSPSCVLSSFSVSFSLLARSIPPPPNPTRTSLPYQHGAGGRRPSRASTPSRSSAGRRRSTRPRSARAERRSGTGSGSPRSVGSLLERFAKTLRRKSATFERNLCARHTFW